MVPSSASFHDHELAHSHTHSHEFTYKHILTHTHAHTLALTYTYAHTLSLTHTPACPHTGTHAHAARTVRQEDAPTVDKNEGLECANVTRQKQTDKGAASGKKKRNLKLAHGSARTHHDAPQGARPATAAAAAANSNDGGAGLAALAAGRERGGGGKMTKRTVTAFFRQPAQPAHSSDLDSAHRDHDSVDDNGRNFYDHERMDSSRSHKMARAVRWHVGGGESDEIGEELEEGSGSSCSHALYRLLQMCVAPGASATLLLLLPFLLLLLSLLCNLEL